MTKEYDEYIKKLSTKRYLKSDIQGDELNLRCFSERMKKNTEEIARLHKENESLRHFMHVSRKSIDKARKELQSIEIYLEKNKRFSQY